MSIMVRNTEYPFCLLSDVDTEEEQQHIYSLRSRGTQRRIREHDDDDDDEEEEEEQGEGEEGGGEEEGEAPSSPYSIPPAPAQVQKAFIPCEGPSSIVPPTQPSKVGHPTLGSSYKGKQKKQRLPYAHVVHEVIDLTNEWVRSSYCPVIII